MSNVPPPEPTPESGSRRRRWARVGLTAGAVGVLGVTGAAWWAWAFVNNRLSPWASDLLTKTLDRPVQLGEVERVTPFGLRFGPSALPATATDPDELYVEAIDVRFNPFQLFRRRLTPTFALDGVRAYLEQDETGQWLDIDLDLDDDEDDRDPFIQVNPRIRLRNGEVVALPYLEPTAGGDRPVPLTVGNLNATVEITKISVPDPSGGQVNVDAQEIVFDATAEPENAGRLAVRGAVLNPDTEDQTAATDPDTPRPNDLQLRLAIQGQDLDVAALAPIAIASLPQAVPIRVLSGQLNGNVEVEIMPQEPARLTGTANLDDGAVEVNGVPQAIRGIRGRAQFQGNRVAIDNLTAQYANLTAKAGGLIDTRSGYDLKGEIAPFDAAELLNTLDLDLPIAAEGTFRAEATMTGPLGDPQVSGRFLSTGPGTLDKVQFASLITEWAYAASTLTLESLALDLFDGGRLTGEGTYTFGDVRELALTLTGRELPADTIGRAYGLPDTITLGILSLDATVNGPLDRLVGSVRWDAPGGTYPTRGFADIVDSTVRLREAIVQVAGGTVAATGTIANGLWDATLTATGLQLGTFNDTLAGGVAGGTAQLAGSFADLSLQGIRGSGTVNAALRGAALDSQFTLADGAWNATVQGRNLPVRQFAPNAPVDAVSTDARFAGRFDDLTLEGITGDGAIAAAIAGGVVNGQFSLANGLWQTEGEAQNLQLAQLSPELLGLASGQFQLAGSLADLSPQGLRGQADLTLSEGLATAARLSPQVGSARSPLTASVVWDGRQLQIDRATTAGLFASGTITPQFGPSPGISAIDLALSARDYALAALPLPFPPVLALAGRATFDGRLTGTPANLNLNGSLQLADLALNDLIFDPLLAGDVRFSSRDGLALLVQGGADQIAVNYTVAPRQLNFRIQADEALATGETEGDRLQARVYNFPLSVLNLPPADAAQFGTLRGQIDFASAVIDLRTFATVGQIDVADLGVGYISLDRLFGGFAYADGVASLNNGEIRMTSESVVNGEPLTTVNTYQLSGTFGLQNDPQLFASLSTEQGNIQDIFKILKVAEVADFRRGFQPPETLIPGSTEEAQAILAAVPAGNADASLLNQIRRLSEILALQDLQAIEAEAAPFPPLSEASGLFRGRVQVSASLPNDIAVGFDVRGQDWRWGSTYNAEQVVARGRFQNGLLQLDPLSFETTIDDEIASLTLTGSASLNPEDPVSRLMTLEVNNLPAARLQQPLQLPFELAGRLNGRATLQGRLADPVLRGRVEIVDGELNRRPIDLAEATFSYVAARADIDAQLRLPDADDPLRVRLSTPYRLEFVERRPTNTEVALDIDVRDEGIALLNLFTNQVTWQSGNGTVIVGLRGNWPEGRRLPGLTELNGLISLREATLGVQALPEPLTDVSGQIRLVPYEAVVDRVTGRFSDGEVVARGVFPLVTPLALETVRPTGSDRQATEAAEPIEPIASNQRIPLGVEMSGIDLNLKGLYNGQVDGSVVVGGSLIFGPEVSGDINLSRGRIAIPDTSGADQAAAAAAREQAEEFFFPPPRFANLRLQLVDAVRIEQGGILNVAARGGLTLNGTFNDLRPVGRIDLTSGRISLFTTSLRLTGDDNRAEFRGSFDPILNVTLRTTVPDVSGSTSLITSSPFPRNEIRDATIDNLGLNQQGAESVRIEARVDGPASELTNVNNLDLTSSPPRSRTEIISLLSGSILTALESTVGTVSGQGDNFQGLVNVASLALLARLQDLVGDNFPVSEFRIFPVTDPTGDVNEAADIGGEIGFDISPTISVSVLKVLTNDTPFQFNTRYRISDQFSIRGTTSYEDFRERTGVLLEYETRF